MVKTITVAQFCFINLLFLGVIKTGFSIIKQNFDSVNITMKTSNWHELKQEAFAFGISLIIIVVKEHLTFQSTTETAAIHNSKSIA